jgi:cytochrome c peroxidase
MKNFVALLLSLIFVFTYAGDKSADYVGSNKCKICHKKPEAGSQYGIWSEGPHAKSFETLKNEKSKAIATKMGLKTSPEKAPECLICHVSGWGTTSGYQLEVDPLDKKAVKKNTDLARVGCESCHGAGSLYKSKKTMLGIRKKEFKAEDHGLTIITAETCTVCHNSDSPTYKEFKYEDRVGEIQHPVPAK